MDTTFDDMSKDELKEFLSLLKTMREVSTENSTKYQEKINDYKEICNNIEPVIYELESRIRNYGQD